VDELAIEPKGREPIEVDTGEDFIDSEVATCALGYPARRTDLARFTAGDYRKAHRQLQTARGLTEQRIAYLGNMTLDLLPQFVSVHAARNSRLARSFIGNFNQFHQDISSSALREYAPDVIILAVSFRGLRPLASATFDHLTTQARIDLCDDVLDEIEGWIERTCALTRAAILVTNFPAPPYPGLGIADTAAAHGETEFFYRLNLGLLERVKNMARVGLLDAARVSARIGTLHAFDDRMFHVARSEWTERMMIEMAGEIGRHLAGATGSARKCVVVDLDNSLWGGVLGEDGPHGIDVGPGSAAGEAFAAFQHRLRALKARGILLAICSKNNPDEVTALFEQRPDLPLRYDDFSAVAISWQSKDVGLADIARELNIGLDALVFVDDNPAEILLVEAKLPQVETLLLPPDPSDFIAALDALTCLEKAFVTAEDEARPAQYAQAKARSKVVMAGSHDAGFLGDLEMVATIRPAIATDLPRVHQLFTKTNQFNLTGRRYAFGELEPLLESRSDHLWVATLRDRFGDLGMVSSFIISNRRGTLHVEAIVMSCRAMGRGLERLLIARILDVAVANVCSRVRATFVPTPRNTPIAELLPSHGFTLEKVATGGTQHFVRAVPGPPAPVCDWISLEGELVW
jgi:FkbH-like protein